MKMMHEVVTEIHGNIKHAKCCSRCSNKLQTKNISHTRVIKIAINVKQNKHVVKREGNMKSYRVIKVKLYIMNNQRPVIRGLSWKQSRAITPERRHSWRASKSIVSFFKLSMRVSMASTAS